MAARNDVADPLRRSLAFRPGLMLGLAAASLLVACQSTPDTASNAGPATLSADDAARCQALVGQTLGGTRIERVDLVRRGQKGGRNLFGSSKAEVPFCKVHAVGSSAPGSSIRMEFFLPGSWNGKLMGVGGGGLSGGLSGSTGALMPELARGYAGVANDAGHTDEKKAAWALNAPARIEDFGFRANHAAAVAAKAVVAAYYGRPVEKSYFSACSNGGRDALMLAQRYPEDYDGIIAGAPALNWTGVMVAAQAYHQTYERTPGAERLPAKLGMVREAVMRKCDQLDGVVDDVLENPLACDFDPGELACAEGQSGDRCLTAGEIQVARTIYGGLHTASGERIIHGLPVSSEHGRAVIPIVGWAPWFLNGLEAGLKLSTDFFRGLVHQDLDWDPGTFDLEKDYALALARTGAALDAKNPDLRAFTERGGKLLIFHGWEDTALPAGDTLAYYEAARGAVGARADDSVRLFMAPGMAHCSLGHGPDTLNLTPVIDAWVTRSETPTSILAEKQEKGLLQLMGRPGRTLRTRPLCPWPQTARYRGTGSTDEAANFTCEAPTPAGRSAAR